MRRLSTRVLIEGKEVEITDANLNKRGGLAGSQFNFTMPGDDISFRKYWNKEVTFFLHKDDAYPLFRGRIINTNIVDTYKVKFTATDALGYLGGHHKAQVTLNDNNNVDGLTLGGAIIKLITMASLQNVIGTDFIGDSSPIISTTVPPIRGTRSITSIIKTLLPLAINTDKDIPRENTLMVKDDGSKSQLMITLQPDLDSSLPVYKFNKSNIVSFKVSNRETPTTIVVTGETQDTNVTFRHESAASALGENFYSVTNAQLKSKAECQDFAAKLFEANLKDQYEYTLASYYGAYLEENDIIHITEEDSDVSGTFRVVGKSVSVKPNQYQVVLNINKRPPILAQFLEGN